MAKAKSRKSAAKKQKRASASKAPTKRANTATGAIDLTYDIDEKNKSFIEKIEIQGFEGGSLEPGVDGSERPFGRPSYSEL